MTAAALLLIAFQNGGAVTTAPDMPGSAMVSDTMASDEVAIKHVIARFDAAFRSTNSHALRELFREGKIVWRTTGHPASREFMDKLQGSVSLATEEQGR